MGRRQKTEQCVSGESWQMPARLNRRRRTSAEIAGPAVNFGRLDHPRRHCRQPEPARPPSIHGVSNPSDQETDATDGRNLSLDIAQAEIALDPPKFFPAMLKSCPKSIRGIGRLGDFRDDRHFTRAEDAFDIAGKQFAGHLVGTDAAVDAR